jgi:FAD:protein FMN transferase
MNQPPMDPYPRSATASGRRTFLSLALGACTAAAVSARASVAAQELQWRERILLGFGTTLWLRAAHARAPRADAALDAALTALRNVERHLSLYDAGSALSVLNRDGVLHTPPRELLEVLALARQVAQRSSGAFDVTVQPLMALWQAAHRAGRRPSASELRTARQLVDWRGVEFDSQRVRLRRAGMAVTLNGIAQGYAADRAKAALLAHGIEHALLDTGEWAAWGRGPNDRPWTLGVASPRPTPACSVSRALAALPNAACEPIAHARAAGRAIATSSDAHTAYSADLRDHHILDPRRGRSPAGLASVSVAAPSGALADALTKVFFMAGWHGALPLAQRWGVDVLVVDKAGRLLASPGFERPNFR